MEKIKALWAKFKSFSIAQKVGLMAVIMTVFSPLSAFAAVTNTLADNTAPGASTGYYSYVGTVTGTHWVLVKGDSSSYFYESADSNGGVDIYVKGTATAYYEDNNTWVKLGDYSDGSMTTQGVTLSQLHGNASIYTDTSKSGFFFKPALPVATLAGVAQVPTAILHPMTQVGGILGVGLAILAIMLGVSLVPRLTRLFLH